MTFIKPYLIRLSHCDPTGFVFYPNYFHIFNALVEDWFYEALEIPFDVLLMERRLSLPPCGWRRPSASRRAWARRSTSG